MPWDQKDISDFQQAYQDWGSNSIHFNYDESDEPDKAGWNYLNFDVPVVRDTFVYLVKMDDPKPARKVATDHTNTAKQVIGLVFDLDEEDLVKLRACFLNVILKPKAEESLQKYLANSRLGDSSLPLVAQSDIAAQFYPTISI